MKRLIIDARPLSRNKGGIQRYLEQTLPFVVTDESLEVILYMDDEPNPKLLKSLTKIKTVSFPRTLRAFRLNKLLWIFWVLLNVLKDKPDIYWSPRHHLPFFLPQNCKAIVTIHDMVWKTFPETMPTAQRLIEALIMPLSLRRANTVIAVSDTTKHRIEEFFPKTAKKTRVIKHGFGLKSFDPSSIKDNEFSDYFLAVGTLEPRKNYANLLCAFDEYKAQGGLKNLVIVGKLGWKTSDIFSQLQRNRFSNNVKLLHNANDNQLQSLYKSASGLIMVSLDEGFGLPPLEAYQFSIPIMLSDIEIFRELYPNTEVWVDPIDRNAITEKLFILEDLKTKDRRNNSISHFSSWKESANELLKIIKS